MNWLGLGALLIAALAGGCKEGVGERCLVDSDCSSGLVCNQAQKVCASPGTGQDATVDPPAPPMDAARQDAPPDSP